MCDGDAMKRISNPFTPALKIVPFLVCGFSAFILALLLTNGALQKASVFVVFPGVVAIRRLLRLESKHSGSHG